jgi:hypothetical protein
MQVDEPLLNEDISQLYLKYPDSLNIDYVKKLIDLGWHPSLKKKKVLRQKGYEGSFKRIK